MKPFTALDEVLNARSLTAPHPRGVAPATGFQPLFSNALSAREEPPAQPEPHGDAQIEMVQVDGRVQQIVVICGCGERTVIECAY